MVPAAAPVALAAAAVVLLPPLAAVSARRLRLPCAGCPLDVQIATTPTADATAESALAPFNLPWLGCLAWLCPGVGPAWPRLALPGGPSPAPPAKAAAAVAPPAAATATATAAADAIPASVVDALDALVVIAVAKLDMAADGLGLS